MGETNVSHSHLTSPSTSHKKMGIFFKKVNKDYIRNWHEKRTKTNLSACIFMFHRFCFSPFIVATGECYKSFINVKLDKKFVTILSERFGRKLTFLVKKLDFFSTEFAMVI